MASIIQRKERFYVVAYDGVDPLTGKERRRWHPVGRDRAEAEACAARFDAGPPLGRPVRGGPITLGGFLTDTWMPQKRRQVRATTAYRYAWFIERYVKPAIGEVPLRRLRADHLDSLYETLATNGGRGGTGLAPKTILEVHMTCGLRSTSRWDASSSCATWRTGRAPGAGPPLGRQRGRGTPQELAAFLSQARRQRLYPALHLAAHTSMRRGELVGLKWSDLDPVNARVSISRTLQNVGGRPVEFGVKTRTSRRTVELDAQTMRELEGWRRRLRRDSLPCRTDDWMFCNTTGRFLNPESLSQLFNRLLRCSDLTPIRFHDLRHTHASLLVAAGVPIKVVSERLGHAHPAFTMHTYQHLLPGMSAAAAEQFAALVGASNR